jgi:hypothetical protein
MLEQARFDACRGSLPRARPHQALGMRVPADVYVPSPRPNRGLGDLDYPPHD